MKPQPNRVTDHALVRYLERVVGVDVAAHRLAVARIIATADEHEGATAVVKDGHRYILGSNGRLITVKPAHSASVHTSRCNRRQLND